MRRVELKSKAIVRAVCSYGTHAEVELDDMGRGQARSRIVLHEYEALKALGASVDQVAKVTIVLEFEPRKDE